MAIPGLSVGHVDGAPPGIKVLYSCKIPHTKDTLFKITFPCLHKSCIHVEGENFCHKDTHVSMHYLSHLLGMWVVYLKVKL